MKAAVIFEKGGVPRYTPDFPEPAIGNPGEEVLLSVKAVAVKNLDKARASGRHYSAHADVQQGIVPGGDGVGILPDGTRVYALGITGMLAEKAVVDRRKIIKVPAGLDDATAAALPNAVAGSAMALRFSARMSAGETVLINGATGVTGQVAVQVAHHYGAGKIIVTGRNEQALQDLLELGADEYLVMTNADTFQAKLKEMHRATPVDIVIDYLWGRPATLILETFKGIGDFTHRTRFVSVGSMSGDTILLSSQILRSVNLQLSGSGMGSWTPDEMKSLMTVIIPEMFQLAVEGKLRVETIRMALKDIDQIWNADIPSGKRLTVFI